MDKKVIVGWGQAFFAVLILWAISNVFLGYSIRSWGCDPIVYSCVVFTSASLALLLYSGYGKLAKETVRSIDTWGYGISLMLNYIVLLALLAIITATETTLLQSLSVVISLLTGWFFIGRSISKGQALGATAICFGLFMVLSDLQVNNLGYVIILVVAMAIIQTIRTYIAEFHRPHKHAVTQLMNVKDRARVVALVMFVVSTLFFVCFLGLALLMHQVEGLQIPSVPTIDDFLNPYTVIFGMLAGIILISPLRYFEFSATNAIKTENYLAVSAFAPIATWAWEWGTTSITGIDIRQLTETDAIACALITVGGLFMAASRIRRDRTPESIQKYLCVASQNPDLVNDSREIIANTLEHFQGDIKKIAKSLDIPVEIINALLTDKDKVLAFKPTVLKEVERCYRQHVANVDPLTSLPNRSAFMTELRNNSYDGNVYSVLFIDLDKFKPVNDTYGHEAGDTVLQGVAERLQGISPKGSVITRLGGDEFCILLTKTSKNKASEYVSNIKSEVTKPFKFKRKSISIGASIGVATFPDDGSTPEDLLKMADKGMYKEKKDR